MDVPRPRPTPERRAGETAKKVNSIRRKYKTNLRTRKRFVNGEEEAIGNTVAVLRIAGFNNTDVARVVGISRNQVAAILDKPEVKELLVLLRTNLTNAAIDLLENYTIEAIQALADVLRTSEDDNVRLKAAAEILDRAGIAKLTRSEKKIEETHETTFTDDGIVEAIRDLSPEAQEQAAQMIEQFESFLAANSQTGGEDESD